MNVGRRRLLGCLGGERMIASTHVLKRPGEPFMHSDDIFLERAIELARLGSQAGDGGPFGAVIVRAGTIIGEGWNQVVTSHDPTAHAEVSAIRAACATVGHFHLPGSILYASSEPCPMCLAAAYWARVDRIVFANSRLEAAAIGFCDDDLYEELNRPHVTRRILMEHHPNAEALAVMAQWAADPTRVPY